MQEKEVLVVMLEIKEVKFRNYSLCCKNVLTFIIKNIFKNICNKQKL